MLPVGGTGSRVEGGASHLGVQGIAVIPQQQKIVAVFLDNEKKALAAVRFAGFHPHGQGKAFRRFNHREFQIAGTIERQGLAVFSRRKAGAVAGGSIAVVHIFIGIVKGVMGN